MAIDENIQEKMLYISGKNSLTSDIKTDSNDSRNYLVDSQLIDKNIPLNDEKASVSNTMSNKERVQRFIDCMKIKQEIKKKHEVSKINMEENTQVSINPYKNVGASFQNRFLAQKNIIDMQKSRLLEQERIINDLKMGIMSKEDIQRTDKYDLAELFQDCKMKLLGRVPLDYIPKNQGLLVKPQTAPKIIQELEKRALERMKYREMIKERKKLLEETKKKIQEENLRRKHQMEEEERLKHLEMLNERHRQEQERMKIRKINKEIFQRNLNKAIAFNEKNVLRRAFHQLKCEYFNSKDKEKMSEEHNKKKILEKSFKILLEIIHYKYSLKCEIADGFRRKVVLKMSWRGFKENHLDGIRSWQVAEDFNDFRIERNFLIALSSFTSKEKILRDIKTQQACYHYQRKLIFYSFFHWKSLPLVLKMEKVKEERKQKWRKKVLEILPDFNPSET